MQLNNLFLFRLAAKNAKVAKCIEMAVYYELEGLIFSFYLFTNWVNCHK